MDFPSYQLPILIDMLVLISIVFSASGVYFKERKTAVSDTYLMFALWLGVWMVCDGVPRVLVNDHDSILLMIRSSSIFWIGSGLFLLRFTYALVERAPDRLFGLFTVLTVISAGVAVGTSGVFSNVVVHEWGWWGVHGPYFTTVLLLGPIMPMVCSIYLLNWSDEGALSAGDVQAGRYLQLGIALSSAIGVVFTSILPNLGYSDWVWVSSLAPMIQVVCVYFAVDHFYYLDSSLAKDLSALLGSFPEGILIVDRLRTVVYMSPSAAGHLGLIISESVGVEFATLINERPDFEQKTPFGAEECVLHRQGKILSVSRTALSHRFRTIEFVLMVRDITEQRAYEARILAARIEAEEANQAKDVFVAHMNHELRTPLNGMLGMLELLTDTPLTEEQLYMVEVALSSANIQLEMVNNVLDFSKMCAGKMEVHTEPFELNSVLDQVNACVLGTLSKKHVDYSIEIREVSLKRLGDASALTQVLTNLVGNAVKFTDQGFIRLILEPQKGGVLFRVEDSGSGIARDRLPTLFEPFVQAESSVFRQDRGTGLGTTIARSFVSLMGGELWVRSELGLGSTFGFWLPLPTQEGQEEPVFSVQTPRASSGVSSRDSAQIHQATSQMGCLVLVVEDNMVNMQVMSRLLTRLGAVVDWAKHGEEAVEMANAKRYDLIMMDLHMPYMEGIEATRLIRAACKYNRETPIIALTANATQQARQRCDQAGMSGFLTKPLSKLQLNAALREICPGQFKPFE